MKSSEFIIEDKQKGTYAGVHFNNETKNAIKEYIKENDIPNATPTDKLHCTLLYSRKHCPNYTPLGELDPVLVGEPDKFQVWEGQPDDDGHKPNCLIMEFNCAKLSARHKELMDEHDATYDFPEYKTHITFSYDIGEMDIKDLPAFDGPINIVEEYSEDLDLVWAENNAKISENQDIKNIVLGVWNNIKQPIHNRFDRGQATCTYAVYALGTELSKNRIPFRVHSGDAFGTGHWWITSGKKIYDLGCNADPNNIETGKIVPIIGSLSDKYKTEDVMDFKTFKQYYKNIKDY